MFTLLLPGIRVPWRIVKILRYLCSKKKKKKKEPQNKGLMCKQAHTASQNFYSFFLSLVWCTQYAGDNK